MNRMGIRVSASSVSVAVACGLGHRTLSTASKALTGLGGNRKVGKNAKASSELCKFLGVPDQSRSDNVLLISKFIKLYNSRVHILSFPCSLFSPRSILLRFFGLFRLLLTKCLMKVLTKKYENLLNAITWSIWVCPCHFMSSLQFFFLKKLKWFILRDFLLF